MINQYETAYPRFKPYLNKTDLIEVYTPTKKETLFAKKKTSNKLNCLGLLVQLKVFQKLGFFIKFNKVPEKIIEYIANCIQLKSIDKRKLSDYDRTSIRNHHQKLIRTFTKVSAYDKKAESILFESALKSAQINERLPDIINAMLEQIVKDCYELPAFSTFENLARKARTQVKYCIL